MKRSVPGAIVALALGASALAAIPSGFAVAASGASDTSVSVNPSIVEYGGATDISGRLASGHSGVTVLLERRGWPFTRPFHVVAVQKTGRDGSFRFRQWPARASEYEVVVRSTGARSSQANVYVVATFTHVVACRFVHKNHDYGCHTHKHPIPAGNYAWELTFELRYPSGVFATEKSKPAYVYFAQRYGTLTKFPSKLRLRRTVLQKAAGEQRVRVHVTQTVKLTGQSTWQLDVCTQTSERTDGFGLPGAPGSHHCGPRTITQAQASDYQG